MEINKITGKWAVNGSSVYDPTSAVVTNDNIVSADTGRTENGTMYITWVRPTVRTVKLTYEWITGAEVSSLHSLMQGKEFRFTFPDGSGSTTIQAYAGKDSYTIHNPSLYADAGGLYKNYTIDIIEM